MNMLLIQTALFVRDLLTYPESLIKIGRAGDDIDDFTIGYIAVDTLGQSTRRGTSETYDGVLEKVNYSEQWQAPVTLSFYGNGAWKRASDFSALLKSQKALELQESLGIGVYRAGGLTDVKLLTGQQYGERQELTLNVQFTVGVDVDTLRIDTEQIDLLTN